MSLVCACLAQKSTCHHMDPSLSSSSRGAVYMLGNEPGASQDGGKKSMHLNTNGGRFPRGSFSSQPGRLYSCCKEKQLGLVYRKSSLAQLHNLYKSKTIQEWLWDTSLNVLEWPSQSPDLNPIKHLWRDLKIAVQQRSPSYLTELERICREE
uniref:Tc1-like transposase DDE domain-containing protein n=1 Tax=Salmo trutta TaxID=8032 RepID=A0A673WNS2_SALTR